MKARDRMRQDGIIGSRLVFSMALITRSSECSPMSWCECPTGSLGRDPAVPREPDGDLSLASSERRADTC
jgi:hypothetical protein